METKMAMQSRLHLEKHSKEQILKMSNMLSSKAQKFNEDFRKLLLKSKVEFHNMYTRTYGIIYQQNSYVFSDLFKELENYYARGRVDLIDVMDKFFNTLYQKMFQVLNAQHQFDEKYLRCVSEHMKELKPFGDVPDKLSVQIKRSFVATRTYGQALATAAEVSKKLINVRLNADCTAALTKMAHCGACKGYAEKPCTNYCVNVIKGCLHYFNEFDVEWENFALAMDKLAERLLGSFNIVMVVEPINIKISEAIMNFQDSGVDITNRVFQGCGRPILGRTSRAVNPKFAVSTEDTKYVKKRAATLDTLNEQIESDILDIDAALDEAIVLRERRAAEPGSRDDKNGDSSTRNNGNNNNNNNNNNRNRNQKRKQQNRKNDNDDYSGRDPILDKLVRDIRQRVKDSKKFWSNLPHQICANDEISSSSDVDGMCWNGHTIDRYMHSVTTEHGRNPEFPGNPASTRQTSLVATQLYYLKNAVNHLRSAYTGQDVDWTDQDAFYGSGSGSGGGSDDEDDDEGSGISGSPFTPSHKPDHTDRPSVRVNNVDDEDTEVDEDIHIGGGGGSVITHTTGGTSGAGHETNVVGEDDNNSHNADNDDDDELNTKTSGSAGGNSKPQRMSLRRALLLYLLPLYMAWFGGIFADLL
ncbi:glypican-4-like isoform X2 [Teleopsis dalmanni]|uniref:glypican-4-like isoform X2 n=1 Tax=Teleopsis dalmanni TaxID=139649 RepID=UPI0018CE33AD|nr:glypican-4-like isoform X2 [Teleopsis dalmanni]